MKNICKTTLIIISVFCMFGCSTTEPVYMSKDTIRQLKNIVVIVEPEEEKPKIIDPTDIRGQAYDENLLSWAQMNGPLAVLLVSAMAEVQGHYDTKNAIGEDGDSFSDIKTKQEYLTIIQNGIAESFREQVDKCDYINFDNIVFLNDHLDENFDYKKYDPDHIVSIKYVYGISISKVFPPQPAISASLVIYNPKTEQLIEKRTITSDSYSMNKSQGKIPSLKEYSENNAGLFKGDIGKVAKLLGKEVARLYTYY